MLKNQYPIATVRTDRALHKDSCLFGSFLPIAVIQAFVLTSLLPPPTLHTVSILSFAFINTLAAALRLPAYPSVPCWCFFHLLLYSLQNRLPQNDRLIHFPLTLPFPCRLCNHLPLFFSTDTRSRFFGTSNILCRYTCRQDRHQCRKQTDF